jgi:sugar lactone lactonase YvrE
VNGVVDATLRLLSNDAVQPETDIPLHADVESAPIAEVSPPADAAAVAAGQEVTHRLVIANRGGSPLAVTLSARSLPEESPACDPREALATQSSGELSRIDLASGAVERIAYVHDPWNGLAAAPDGASAYVVESGAGVVQRIALDTGATEVVAGGVPGATLALSPDGGTLYRSESARGFLRVQDVASGAVRMAAAGLQQPGPLAVSADGTAVYLAETGAGRLLRVDVATGGITTVASDLGVIAGLDVDEASGSAFVSVPDRYQVLSVDLATGTATSLADLLASPQGLAALPEALLVAESGSGRILRIDRASGAVSVVARGLTAPAGIALLPARGCGAPAIRFDPPSTTVPPGGTAEIATVLSGLGVRSGSYAQEIHVSSNDPARPDIAVPVALTVMGAPRLDLGGDEVSVSSVLGFAGPGAVTRHTLQPGTLPVAQARLEVGVNGGFSGRDMKATFVAKGEVLLVVGGTGRACFPGTLERTLSDATLESLLTDGSLQVTVQNAESVTSACADNQHSVTLSLSPRLETLDFGAVSGDQPVTRSVLVANAGTADLTVSSVSSDLPQIVPAAAVPFAVPPGGALRLFFTFNPGAPGPFTGSLTIGSDDPLTPLRVVPVTGTVASGPGAR